MPARRRLSKGTILAAVWGVLLLPLAAYALDVVPPPLAEAVGLIDNVAVTVLRLIQAPLADSTQVVDEGHVVAVYHTYSPPSLGERAALGDQASASVVVSATTTALGSSANPSTYGTSITYTATVTASDTNPGAGTVDFTEGTALICGAAPLTGNQATCTTNANAGTHSVLASYSGTSRYRASSGGLTQQVNPATLTVTADDAIKTYGDPNPAFTVQYSGFVNNETTAALSGALVVAGPPANSGAGTYTGQIVPSGLSSPNYQIIYVNGTLTINRAALTVTADDASKVYGSANPSFTAHYSAFVNGDTSASLGGILAVTGPSAGSAVGTYPIVPSGLTSLNYSISYVNGTLTITPAPLTVTADNASRLYGASNPIFTAEYAGFVNGDSAASLGGALVFTAPGVTSGAGAYPGAIVPSGLTSGNYTISYVGGTLTIIPAPLTVRSNDASRLYGAANPSFTVTYSGFVNADGPASLGGALAFGAPGPATGVGSYSIIPSGLTSTNYAITYSSGTLTINPAPLTVTVNDATRYYGQVNPLFGNTPLGLVNGETAAVLGSPIYSTPATQTSTVGNYFVTVSGLRSPNYMITFVPGTLHVVKAPTLTALSSGPNPSFNGRPVSLTATVTSGAPSGLNPSGSGTVTFLRGSTVIATVAVDASGQAVTSVASLPVGHDTLTAAYSGDVNYIGSTSATVVEVVRANTIVFSSNRDGNFEIYTLDISTGTQTRLTNNSAIDTSPVFSPDGTRMAFVSTRSGTPQIWLMKADGTNLLQLTSEPGITGTPAWSPDGTQISYTSTRSGSLQLWVAGANGPYPATSPQQLTSNAFALVNSTPAWSPNGRQIAFTSTHSGLPQIWIMNADGSSPSRLSNDAASDSSPAWSPDGLRIAFSSTLHGLPAIYVMDANGANVMRVSTNALAVDATPAWSPDGSQIAFTSTLSGIVEIYEVNASGGGQFRLTNGPPVNALPGWCCTQAP